MLAVGLWAGGCGSGPLDDEWIEPRPLAGPVPVHRPPRFTESDRTPGASKTEAAEPQGSLTLAQSIAAALLYNPELESFAWSVRSAEARALQASLLPNPRLGFVTENRDGPSNVTVRNTIRISQVFETAGKRRKRTDLAEANRTLATWDYEERRIYVVREVARRHIAVLAAQKRVKLGSHTVELAEQVLKIVQDRVRAGVVPGSERDRALVRLSSEKIRLNRDERRLLAARHSLASSWAGREARFTEAVGPFEQMDPLPGKSKLLADIGRNPRIARWGDEIEQRRRNMDLAVAGGTSDMTAGVGLRHFADTDETAFLVELSAPIPIMDRNQGRVLEARYELARARTRQRASRVKLVEELNRHYQALAASHFEATTLDRETLPAARAAFAAARNAYQKGRTDYLEVLDAERTLVDIERQWLNALESYHQARAEVEALIAGPLDGTP